MDRRRLLLWPAALLPLLLAVPAAPCLGLSRFAALGLGSLPLLAVVVLTLRGVLPPTSCSTHPQDAWAGGLALALYVAALVAIDRVCPLG